MTRRLCVGVARCRGGRRAENGSADCHQGFKARSSTWVRRPWQVPGRLSRKRAGGSRQVGKRLSQ